VNEWFLGLDTASLYSCVRRWRPSQYVEVGSGSSTAVAARAIRDGRLLTSITSIDPAPRREIDDICDEVVRKPLELANLDVFSNLVAGDIVFFDGSHRVFTNSDVAVFYLDVLPGLPDGVLVGIHDVLWPDDYLPEWSDYWWSELYVFGAMLLAEPSWLHPLLACNYVSQTHELAKILDPLWDEPRLEEVDRRGFSFWLTVRRSVDRPSSGP
jgi:hypothetical protein